VGQEVCKATTFHRLAAAIEANTNKPGSSLVQTVEIDRFAAMLRVNVAVLRQDVRSAADYAVNAVAIRREDRKAAADGKRIITDLIPNAERALRRISRLDARQVERSTVAKSGSAETLTEAVIRKAADLSANLSVLLAQIDYVRLPAGGGSDQDRLATKLIERLARIWTRHTNQPAPGGSSGPFVEFVAAAWTYLGFPEFTNRRGEAQPLLDAIGNRVEKFHRRHNRAQNKC
jgi:hypothetical protein